MLSLASATAEAKKRELEEAGNTSINFRSQSRIKIFPSSLPFSNHSLARNILVGGGRVGDIFQGQRSPRMSIRHHHTCDFVAGGSVRPSVHKATPPSQKPRHVLVVVVQILYLQERAQSTTWGSDFNQNELQEEDGRGDYEDLPNVKCLAKEFNLCHDEKPGRIWRETAPILPFLSVVLSVLEALALASFPANSDLTLTILFLPSEVLSRLSSFTSVFSQLLLLLLEEVLLLLFVLLLFGGDLLATTGGFTVCLATTFFEGVRCGGCCWLLPEMEKEEDECIASGINS